MSELIVVIIVLGIMLVLLLSIGDFVGAVALGLVIMLVGWAYRSTMMERLGEKQKKQN